MSGQIIGPIGVLPTGGGAWTPATLGANLIAWFKADVGVTGTTSVTAWADQSGNANNLAQQGSNPLPSWSATGLNSKPAVTFALGQVLIKLSGVNWGTGNSYAIFGIASTTANSIGTSPSTAQQYNGFQIYDSAVSVSASLTANGGTPALANIENNVSTLVSSKAITINATHRIGVNCNGTNSITYVDGSAGSTGTTTLTAMSNNGGIGLDSSDVGSGWDGPVSELIFVNRVLTGTELTQIDTYLTSRQ